MSTDYVAPFVEPAERHTSCQGKRGFATLHDAQVAAFNTVSDRPDPGDGPQGYDCPACPWFHVGHPPTVIAEGLATADEWYRQGARIAVRSATADIVRATGHSPAWSRVGEAWRVAITHPVFGEVASKPSADPGLAAESLLRRLRRRGGGAA